MKIVVGGGSGFVGRALVRSLAADGHDVVVLSREAGKAGGGVRAAAWDDAPTEVDGSGAVVNLAGTSIAGPRWTRNRKQAILSSRVDTTAALVAAMEAAESKPGVLVTASGIDYYGSSGDAVVDESSPPGDTFLSRVCVAWEAAGASAPARHVAVRTALVLDREARAVKLMALPFRFLAGGPLGGGQQWFPWLHLEDLVRVYRLAIDDPALAGPVNAAAPEQVRQADAAREIAAVLHRPAALPTPAFALRAALGEQADLLLDGQRAVSRKLDAFEFGYRTLRVALEDALG